MHPRLHNTVATLLLVAGAALVRADAAPRLTHWSFVAPQRPELPAVQTRDWPRNAIDYFTLARLERDGLAPSPAAARAKLLRRVFLDLIGLPPTVEQVDAFLAADRPDAYERAVDDLLASSHYGERWARPWLDLARYADSNGFQRDGFRDVWPFRDWVIGAINADVPFDRFTIEQIAGDLLPNATRAQQIATGFHRGPTVNVEAGVDQEQNRVNAVVDRVNTTATVWLGLTLACAQCHEHKYDPFTQRDYYRLFAYFNNTPIETAFRSEKDTAAIDFTGPWLTLPSPPEKQKQREAVNGRRASLTQELKRNPKDKALHAAIAECDKTLKTLAPTRTLVMREQSEARATHILERGDFQAKGTQVTLGVPAILHGLAKDAPPNRLGLARWLVDPRNPLVARVTVNRWWAEFFGQGLVASLEDFGTQGTPPTHPALLDCLATEFVRTGWSRKAIHRTIVTSATYRQSSRVTPALLARDPYNRLYARGPRHRLDAETIRDNALAVAGLLARKMGGPPVYPPQPAGVWRVTGKVDNTYHTSTGPDRFRRSIYTVWRRSAPYPSFVAFDAPDRAACVVKRPRTNTPLQALTLLNDPVYVEMAFALAARILADRPDASESDRMIYAFRLCLARPPKPAELAELLRLYESECARLDQDPAAARARVGKHAMPTGADVRTVAAWFAVANVLLNLDEAIVKG